MTHPSTPQKKPKLLLVITKSNFGGAQLYVYEMAKAMRDEFDVVVACGGRGVLTEKLAKSDIRCVEIDGFQRNVNPLQELRSWRALYRLYHAEQPDIVHLNSSKAGLSGAVIGRPTRVPQIVFTIHGWPFLEPRAWWWKAATWFGMYLTALFCHTLIPISKYDKAHARMPFIEHKYSRVIYNAVPPIDFYTQTEAREQLVGSARVAAHQTDTWLLTTAELHPKKNLATAITAVAAYNRAHPTQPIYYVICGEGVLREDLLTHIRRECAEDQIVLLGYVADVRTKLTAADIFVLPSHQEGLSYALLEAGAAGLPIIASNVCGLPEVIRDRENGRLIDPSNTESLITALEHLTTDQAAARRYASTLQKEIREFYNLDRMVRETKAVYQRPASLR